MVDNRALPNANDFVKAIEVTLQVWTNADGSPLSTEQRNAIIGYLINDVSSGPGGAGGGRSFASWVFTQLESNRPYLVDSFGDPLTGVKYGFFGGGNSAAAVAHANAINNSGGRAALLGNTPWSNFTVGQAFSQARQNAGSNLQSFIAGRGWSITSNFPSPDTPLTEKFATAISDISFGVASAGYAKATVLYGDGEPFVYNSNIDDNRILGQIELPILNNGGQRPNGFAVGAGPSFEDVQTLVDLANAEAETALGPGATNAEKATYIVDNGLLEQGTEGNRRLSQRAYLGDIVTQPDGSVTQESVIDAITDRFMQDYSNQPGGLQPGTPEYDRVRQEIRTRLDNVFSDPDLVNAIVQGFDQQTKNAISTANIAQNIKIGVPGGLLGDVAEYLNNVYDDFKKGNQTGDWSDFAQTTAQFGVSIVISGLLIAGTVALATAAAPILGTVVALGWLAFGVYDAIVNFGELSEKILADVLNLAEGTWLSDIFGPYFTDRDPLVLDLNTGDVSLRSLALSEAFFDLDSNGFAEKTGWIQPGEGLLALDVNGNGRIDNGSELFGTPTVDGFTILSQYDSNGDNQITSADAIWDSLLIWRDDGDAISTSAELTNITSEDIVSIDLNDVRPGRFDRTREGNTILRAVNDNGDFDQLESRRA